MVRTRGNYPDPEGSNPVTVYFVRINVHAVTLRSNSEMSVGVMRREIRTNDTLAYMIRTPMPCQIPPIIGTMYTLERHV